MKRNSVKPLGFLLALLLIMACSTIGGGPDEESVSIEEPASSDAGGVGEEPAPSEEGGVDNADEEINSDDEEGTDSEESSGITSEVTPVTVSGLCANTYYPVLEGAAWNYQGTSSETENYTFSNTITSVREDGFTVTVEFDEVTLVQEWSCTPDGILALDMGGGSAGTLTTDNVNLVMDTQNASGITYPKEITPGKTWQHGLEFTGTMDINGESFDVSGNTIYNYTAVGIESVSVPAGTFDAFRLNITTTININLNIGGAEAPVTVTSTGASWFAENVGWIKSESSSDIVGFSTNESIESTSYSIP